MQKRIAALSTVGALGLAVTGGVAAASMHSQQKTANATIKVGLVTDIGGLNDRSFNFLANKGLQEAGKKLKVQVSVRTSNQNSDYIPNIQRLVAQGNNLIITVGYLMGDATVKMAKKYPNVKFAIIDLSSSDATINKLPNVRGLLFEEQEAGYLAGYLTGLVEKAGTLKGLNAKQVVGSVGGQKIPPVDHYIAGFRAGAKRADPGITTLNSYSQTFVDQGKCKEQTLAQISQGADVDFQVAGQCGLGTLSAAEDKGVWGIGVDADQSYLGPYILTSAMKRVDTAVYDTVEQTVQGKFKGGVDGVFSLNNQGVGLGTISPQVPKAIVAKVEAVKKEIIAGKVTIPSTV